MEEAKTEEKKRGMFRAHRTECIVELGTAYKDRDSFLQASSEIVVNMPLRLSL